MGLLLFLAVVWVQCAIFESFSIRSQGTCNENVASTVFQPRSNKPLRYTDQYLEYHRYIITNGHNVARKTSRALPMTPTGVQLSDDRKSRTGDEMEPASAPMKVLKKVTGAFDSPSLISYMRDAGKKTNPFDSPSCLVNGGKTARAINPEESPSVIMLRRKSPSGYNALSSPSVTRLGISENKLKNVMSSPSLQITSEARTKLDMPLSLVVGQESIKTALILLAVNPNIGGLAITGSKGTAKSVMARALHRVMPPIERIKGSQYNIAPDAGPGMVDDFLSQKLRRENSSLCAMETEIVTCPFVQVPVNVLEDRLFGSVDVKKTLESGQTVFTPGLLASAHRGILYIDDINLLDTDLTTMLLQAVTDGFVIVEREGISVRYPCKPMLICTLNPQDSELKDVFLDRIGIALNADTEPLTMQERVEAVSQVLRFSEGRIPTAELQAVYEKEEQLKAAIVFAREYIKGTKLTGAQMTYLCEEAQRGGCQGHRAEISAARVALASAALEDASTVRSDDLRLAVKLAIYPRSIYRDQPPPPHDTLAPPPPPASKAPPKAEDQQSQQDENKDDNKDDKEDEQEQDQEEPQEPEEGGVPEEFMFAAEAVDIGDNMLKFSGRQRTGKGGKSGVILSRDRGRYIRPVLPKEGAPLRLAIDATLREAAKHQVYRRAEAEAAANTVTAGTGAFNNPQDGRAASQRIYLESSDLRGKLMARKAGSLLIFAVDASGSMALNRMNAAKGAACGLLTEAYQSRDKIALIPFQGNTAEVLLPPTRSIALAKNRLDMMPCGGGSPLAHALSQAVRTGLNAMASGDVGRCVIVLISDGRANVPLDVSLGTTTADTNSDPSALDADGKPLKLTDAEKKEFRTKLKDEVLTLARQIASMPAFKLLVIDTENKFVSTGMAKEIATAAGGRYHFIPKASADAMKQVTVDAVASLKKEQKSR